MSQGSKTKISESFEFHLIAQNNWYEVSVYSSGDGISVYFKNIDERKKAAEDLKNAFNEKNNILESLGDAFYAIDNQWIITYWNKEAENLFGLKRDGLIGKNLKGLFVDSHDHVFFEYYEHAMFTGSVTNFEEFYSPRNKWFDVSVYPSKEGLSIYIKDITLKKEMEIGLIEAHERFEKVTEATNDAIWDWNILEDTLYWGEGFKNLFGYDGKKMTSSFELWENNIHPEDRNLVFQSLHTSLKDPNQYNWKFEYRYKKHDGSYAEIIDRGVIIRNKQKIPVRMVGAMVDFTERKKIERQLLDLNKSLKIYTKELEVKNDELEQFAFITSHDLQEPLRMISSFMDLLKKKYGSQLDEKAHQYIHFASDGAKRMRKIILDLLEYSRAGKFTENKEEIDLSEIIENYQFLRRKVIAEKSAKILYEILPKIESFKAPLTQIIHCLFDNSIYYSKDEEPPIINLSVISKTDYWQIIVSDNGIGIEPQFHQKVFVIFQRLNVNEKFEGTGIGLSIVKKHVESWGGKVWIQSYSGAGTKINFTIPK